MESTAMIAEQTIGFLQPLLGRCHDIFSKTVLLRPIWLEEIVQMMSEVSFVPPDQIRYLFCLLLAYPLAIVYARMWEQKMKQLFDVLVGIGMAQFVLGSEWIHSFITATITYVLVSYGHPKYAPRIAFVFNLAYLSFSHIYRIYVDYMGWSLDFTGPQMILVIKLTSFAYNYYDGVIDIKRLETTPDNKNLARIYETRRKYAIHHLPGVLEYFGYVYCFPTFLAGPAFEIREYVDVTSGKKFGSRGQPSSAVAAVSKLVVGLVCLATFQMFGSIYPISIMYHPNTSASPLVLRIAICWAALLFVRMKYYFAWKVAEGATVLCGYGFEGYEKDGSNRGWNSVSNIDIWSFETAQSIRAASRSWNKGTQAWLERYVYSRMNNSLAATYFVSAFWHGFYPGYYLFFMSVPLATSVNRLAYKRLRPWFLESDGSCGRKKDIYDGVSIVLTSLTVNYLVMPFQALSWEYAQITWGNFHCSGHLIMLALYAALNGIPMQKVKSI